MLALGCTALWLHAQYRGTLPSKTSEPHKRTQHRLRCLQSGRRFWHRVCLVENRHCSSAGKFFRAWRCDSSTGRGARSTAFSVLANIVSVPTVLTFSVEKNLHFLPVVYLRSCNPGCSQTVIFLSLLKWFCVKLVFRRMCLWKISMIQCPFIFFSSSSCKCTWLLCVSKCFKTLFCNAQLFKSNQITFIVTSPQHKCLGEWNSYERAPDSAEKQQTIYIWTDSAKKQQQTIYIWTDSAKKTTNNLHMDRQCRKTTDNLHMDRQCKKLHWSIYSAPDSAKKQQQQFTYGQTVQKNNSNLHMDSTYLQTVQKTMCKIHIHVLSTLSVL